MPIRTISQLAYKGTCPGGTYFDNMAKPLPCPSKSYIVPIDSHSILLDDDNNPIILCTRCQSPIPLTDTTKTNSIKVDME